MKRRQVLYATSLTGIIGVAGCLGGPSTQGNDDTPINAEPENLIPSASFFEDNWERSENTVAGLHPVELEPNTVSAAFNAENGEEGVDLEVTMFDSVDAAMSGYQQMRDSDFEGGGDFAENIDIASEGHQVNFDTTIAYFRDANVIGALSHVTNGSSNTLEYAAEWHETWREN